MSAVHSRFGTRLVTTQFVLTLVIALILLLAAGVVPAYSGLTGGLISTLANVFFASKLFNNRGSWQPKHLAANVYWGEIGKLLITIAMFLMAVVLIIPLDVIVLFVVYLLVQISPAVVVSVWRNAEMDQS